MIFVKTNKIQNYLEKPESLKFQSKLKGLCGRIIIITYALLFSYKWPNNKTREMIGWIIFLCQMDGVKHVH